MYLFSRAVVLGVLLSLSASVSFADTSAKERLEKGVKKFASTGIASSPDFKPKRLCFCNSGPLHNRTGFLVTGTGDYIECAIPTMFDTDGSVVVVDYSCQDIMVLR